MKRAHTFILAAIFGMAECLNLSAQQTNTIFVFDDGGQPVLAEVFTLAGDMRERIGLTELDGHITAPIPCKRGQRILIKPADDARYYQNKRTECPLQQQTKVVVL